MKARIYILVIVFAAGLVTALAQETKTNAVPGAGEPAVPPPVTAPATSTPGVAKDIKPPAAGPLTPTSPVPIQPKITATPRMSSPESTGTSHKEEILTNPLPSASTMTEGIKPPDDGSSTPTSAVPAEADVTAATSSPNAAAPPESSGLDRKTALLIGAAILLVAGGLAIFMWRRASVGSHGSLISSALNLVKYDDKTDDKTEEKSEAQTEVKSEGGNEVKKEEKKFPPPMN